MFLVGAVGPFWAADGFLGGRVLVSSGAGFDFTLASKWGGRGGCFFPDWASESDTVNKKTKVLTTNKQKDFRETLLFMFFPWFGVRAGKLSGFELP